MEDIDLTCPVTKKPCPLHDIGSGNRHWCDDRGDPSELIHYSMIIIEVLNKMAEYEDIFRLRKRQVPDEELREIEEIKKKTIKNKFSFLLNGTMNLTDSEIEKLNQPELESIVPETWKQDYEEFKAK